MCADLLVLSLDKEYGFGFGSSSPGLVPVLREKACSGTAVPRFRAGGLEDRAAVQAPAHAKLTQRISGHGYQTQRYLPSSVL
jgi:hypothetical protein